MTIHGGGVRTWSAYLWFNLGARSPVQPRSIRTPPASWWIVSSEHFLSRAPVGNFISTFWFAVVKDIGAASSRLECAQQNPAEINRILIRLFPTWFLFNWRNCKLVYTRFHNGHWTAWNVGRTPVCILRGQRCIRCLITYVQCDRYWSCKSSYRLRMGAFCLSRFFVVFLFCFFVLFFCFLYLLFL